MWLVTSETLKKWHVCKKTKLHLPQKKAYLYNLRALYSLAHEMHWYIKIHLNTYCSTVLFELFWKVPLFQDVMRYSLQWKRSIFRIYDYWVYRIRSPSNILKSDGHRSGPVNAMAWSARDILVVSDNGSTVWRGWRLLMWGRTLQPRFPSTDLVISWTARIRNWCVFCYFEREK